jgi:Polysulphide reductase, NrfD
MSERPSIGVTQVAGTAGVAGRQRAADVRVAYDRPVLKAPVWTVEIPVYFYTGGLAGASAGLAFLAGLHGNGVLARRAWAVALAGVSVSPALLVSDLGRPERFLNMLRVFKVTSPMSVGSWVLAGAGATTGVAALDAFLPGRLPRAAGLAAPAAALLGLPLATYTAALVADTSVPAWHEARRELPFVFGAGAAASAGAAAVALTPVADAGPARRLLLGGAAVELGATAAMERRLGELGAPYRSERAGALARAAKALTLAGAVTATAGGRRSRRVALASAALVTAGAVCTRFAVFHAGRQSAADPAATVAPQRRRLRS